MTFGQPFFLWAFLLIPLIMVFLRWSQQRREAALLRLGHANLIGQLSATVNWRGRRWQQRLWLLALCLLIVALARPQWGSEVQVVEQEGVQVMVALDISKSMLAADLKPDRLTRAKFEISDLMNRLNGDEIGLALFSGASFIQFPLTSDYDTARAFLENANPAMISRPGTAIGEAIRTAIQGFDPHRSNQKVIVIMTDGEDHAADAVTAAKEAANQGIRIYTIGFGSPQGEPIPEFDDQGKLAGYKKDANGAPILSKLNEVALQQLALATQGRYFRASASGEELDALAAELDQLQKAQLESRFTIQKIERYQLFLLAAIMLLLLHELIPDRVRQPTPTTKRWWHVWPKPASLLLFLFGFGLVGCRESAGEWVAQGNDAFAQREYTAARTAYQSAQALDTQAAAPVYNLANTFYRQGVYTDTQALLPEAINLADGSLAQSSYYNLGNAHYQTQQWERAIEAYKEALRRNPADQDAKHNLELALQHLQAQQQQQEQQGQNQSNQEQQQNQANQQQNQEQQGQQQGEQQQQNQEEQGQQQPKEDQPKQEQAGQGQERQEQNKQGQQPQTGDEGDPKQVEQANGDDPQAGQPAENVQVLSEAQARQLLNSVSQKTQTLQEKLQGVYVVPGPPPDKDW